MCQSCPGEEGSRFHVHEAVFTLLLLDDLLNSRRSLVHQVPASNAAVEARVDLSDGRKHKRYDERTLALSAVPRCVRRAAYRFDDEVGAVGQTGDVDLGLQYPVGWREEALGAVDAHHSFFANLHTDAALQFIHRDLRFTQYRLEAHNTTRQLNVSTAVLRIFLTTCHCPSLMAFPPLVTLKLC